MPGSDPTEPVKLNEIKTNFVSGADSIGNRWLMQAEVSVGHELTVLAFRFSRRPVKEYVRLDTCTKIAECRPGWHLIAAS